MSQPKQGIFSRRLKVGDPLEKPASTSHRKTPLAEAYHYRCNHKKPWERPGTHRYQPEVGVYSSFFLQRHQFKNSES